MSERHLKKKKLLGQLEVSESLIKKWKKSGCPGFVKGKGWPLFAICKWVVSRPQERTDRTPVRENATRILAEADVSLGNHTAEISTEDSEFGLEAALIRLREAEANCHARWLEALEKGAVDAPAKFKAWQDSLDLLRKSEANLVKLLAERKTLLRASEVKTKLFRMIEVAKTNLLHLPSKIAPALDGEAWPVIQQTMEREIRSALRHLSSDSITE